MQRHTLSLVILTASLTWIASTASAQHYGYGHADHVHYGHGHDGYRHLNHGYHGHGYYDHLHHGSVDHLTYPVAPAVQFYADPVFTEPNCLGGLTDKVYCPESGYCPSETFSRDSLSATPYQRYRSPNRYGQSLDSENHAGHDHADHDHSGHDHAGHSHASPAQSPDTGFIPPPTLSPRQFPSQPDLYSRSRQTQPPPQPSGAREQEAPIEMDGPPPSF